MAVMSGERGIRTLGTVARTTVFETAPFGRSGISPGLVQAAKIKREKQFKAYSNRNDSIGSSREAL